MTEAESCRDQARAFLDASDKGWSNAFTNQQIARAQVWATLAVSYELAGME